MLKLLLFPIYLPLHIIDLSLEALGERKKFKNGKGLPHAKLTDIFDKE